MASPISRKWFSDHGRVQIPDCYPIRIMQFGEGNFMRAFVDWIFQRLNDSHLFTGTIAVVQPIEQGMVEALRQQEYVYSLILRGMDDGDIRDEPYFIDVIRDGVNPYLEWNSFLALATRPELQYVVSNTTEAGIVYRNAAQPSVVCPATFPAKVAAMLVVRHDAVSAALDKGLTFLPCELIETNGEKLKDAVMRHLSDWGLSSSVGEWVEASCRFCNTLVDRIVTGYPAAEAEAIWEKLDCRDKLLVVGEYFHLWVIEGDPLLAEQLPFDQAGLNVIVTDNLKPYRDRKVRVLNGAHTGNVLAAYLAGSDTVAEMMKDRELGAFLRSMGCDEIL
ncbi:MAG: tagaturonate reductase, partial [Planctomycetes bacterium]|nr:tagaturonate reductase [Planctomycetota bacterium]